MANKAIGSLQYTANTSSPSWQFAYSVLDSSGDFVTFNANSYVDLSYSDNPSDVWEKVVAQVRADRSDPTLVVMPAPSSLDFLIHEKKY